MNLGLANAHTVNRKLAEVLSVEKLQIGFLLGAGCPVSVKTKVITEGSDEPTDAPLIPDVAGLTKLIIGELRASQSLKDATHSLLEALALDEVKDPNIEVILGFVRTLQSAAGKGDARGLSAAILREVDDAICKSIQDKVDKALPDRATPYSELAKFIAPRRSNPVEIFTTNYDLLMEQALEDACVPYFDGFIGSRHPFFDLIGIEQDKIPDRWARLWKLHGSINWRQNPDTHKVCRTREPEAGHELLIHPSHRKYDDSRRMPYLALMDRLRSFLRNDSQPVALFIHGFSFSDDHLNAVLEEGMRANHQSACFAFQYADLAQYPGAARLASRCQNFTVLAHDAQISRGSTHHWRIPQSSTTSTLQKMFDWNSDDFTNGQTEVAGKFKLGDFAKFGEYLSSFSPDFDNSKSPTSNE